MLKILPRLDSDELADSRRRELNIPHDGATAPAPYFVRKAWLK